MEAKWAETEYGYVVPGDSHGHIDLFGCRRAAHFVEKPDATQARLLVAAGALWNTMIMVFKVESLFRQIQTLYPDVADLFRALSGVIGTRTEKRKIQEIYRHLQPLNFSKDILEKIAVRFPGSISVLPVLQVTWSDWGSPERLIEIRRSIQPPAESKRPPHQLPSPTHSPPSPEAALPWSQSGTANLDNLE
jgi:mannose-1-phosphate guanylyltransferase